jgi:2,3-bisphosphoglycerate-dependent phosphoglycerate mutase
MSTQIIAVRHGETAWNVDGRIQGHTDIALNATGQLQAKQVGAALATDNIAAVYSSDLQRAFATASAIATPHGLPVLVKPGLRERGFGEFETHTFEEIADFDPVGFASWRAREPHYAPPGGESLAATFARVIAAVNSAAALHDGQTIAVVGHGGVLDALYRSAMQFDIDAVRDWPLKNASINRLSWTEGALSVVQWSDVRHLIDVAKDDATVSPS